MKFGNLNFLEPSGPFQACNGTALPFCLISNDAWSHEHSRDICLIKCAFVGEKNFNIIKMQGTTIKIKGKGVCDNVYLDWKGSEFICMFLRW
jgi:hypothetical protein